jgi:glycosyltransferase involved in cell wall biosynthesis
MVAVSIVVPLYNEEDNVARLHRAVVDALADYNIDYELLLVDDGSKDATFERASALVGIDRRVRVVKFRRNYGQTAAMAAGIEVARGDVIVTMDGDLQNDPEDIPRLLKLIEDGYDIAIGWRRKRKDGGARVFVSKVANKIIARIMQVEVKDSGCSLKAYKAPLIQGIPMYGEMHRFIPALSQLAGARLVQIEVNHRAREFGVSKYGFSRIYKVMVDIISIRALLKYARNPLTWHARVTGFALAFGTAALVYALLHLDQKPIIAGGIAVSFFSLAFFLAAWGMVGQLFAIIEPEVGRYATLSAMLSTRIERPGDSVS